MNKQCSKKKSRKKLNKKEKPVSGVPSEKEDNKDSSAAKPKRKHISVRSATAEDLKRLNFWNIATFHRVSDFPKKEQPKKEEKRTQVKKPGSDIAITDQSEKANKEDSISKWYEIGCKASDTEQWNEAIDAFNKAIELNPDDIDSYYKRGFVFYELGNFEQAIKDCDRAIEINPQFALAYRGRGAAHTMLGNQKQAIEDCNKAIELDPQDLTACNNHFNELISAIRRDDTEAVKVLVEKGVEVKVIKDKDIVRILHYALNSLLKMKFLKGGTKLLLADKITDLNARDENGWTVLFHIARNGDMETTKLLIDKGADLNVRDIEGWTALMMATLNDHREIVKLLIEKGADLNAGTDSGWTALMCAAVNGNRELVELLIEKGADINAKNKNGATALMKATEKDHAEIVKLLVDKGASS
ncbi:MAG: tetratricopeptide repeat protein [Syntrophaceae bacterium]|nr:tetratricopeptide repeat protein [Syntrophaceae bacterium]